MRVAPRSPSSEISCDVGEVLPALSAWQGLEPPPALADSGELPESRGAEIIPASVNTTGEGLKPGALLTIGSRSPFAETSAASSGIAPFLLAFTFIPHLLSYSLANIPPARAASLSF